MSAPSSSWDAILKIGKVELELKGTRGRIFYISNRYSKANNKYLKYYNLKQESKHIIYLDVNNLYGYAMSKLLSTSRFQWKDHKEFDLNKYINNSSKGFVLEVDLEYLRELHESNNDCSLTPNRIEIKRKILSNYQLMIDDFYNITIGNVKKLVPNFFYNENYGLYYENLQIYLRLV